MAKFVFDGTGYEVPQALTKTEIISTVGAPLPDFGIGLIIARQWQGMGYNGKASYEVEPVSLFSQSNKAAIYYGEECDMSVSMKYFKAHGGKATYCLGLSPTTPTAVTMDDTDDPANEAITFTSKNYGAATGDIKFGATWGAKFNTRTATTGFKLTVTLGADAGAEDCYLPVSLNQTVAQTATNIQSAMNTAFTSSAFTCTVNASGYFVLDNTDAETTTFLVAAPDVGTDATDELFGSGFTASQTITGTATWVSLTPDPADVTGGLIFGITPPKTVRYLSAAAATDSPIVTLDYTSGLYAGLSVYLVDNDTAREAMTILSVNKDTTVTFTANPGTAFALTANARIYLEDTSSVEVSPEIGDFDSLLDWFDTYSVYIKAAKESTAKAAFFLADWAAGEFKELDSGSATAGTSPVPTASDWTNIWAMLVGETNYIRDWEIRLICPVSYAAGVTDDNHTNNVAAATFATERRTANYPVAIFAGGILGDVDLSKTGAADYDNPKRRSIAHNNQDVHLCVGGIDGYGAYCSFAPGVMGDISGNPVAHNMTRDKVVASTVEVDWDEEAGEVDELIDAGCICYIKRKSGYFIAKGVNTLQTNEYSWYPSNQTTYMPMQRACVDYLNKLLRDGIDSFFIGADGVTKEGIRVFAMKSLDDAMDVVPAPLLSYGIDSIEPEQSQGWIIKWSGTLPQETNFVGIVSQILVS